MEGVVVEKFPEERRKSEERSEYLPFMISGSFGSAFREAFVFSLVQFMTA